MDAHSQLCFDKCDGIGRPQAQSEVINPSEALPCSAARSTARGFFFSDLHGQRGIILMQSEGWYQAFTGIHAWHGLKPRYSGGAFLLDTCRGKLGN